MELLNSFVITKAMEPDGLSACVLQLAALTIVGSLTTLFNDCLSEGVFPADWKLANVHPILKIGDSHLLTNYRPISVLSILAKVFESIVHRQVCSYFLSNGLLDSTQSGFRPGHSTQDVLLKVTEDWKLALDSDDLVGIVFVDLRKAFDSIDHSHLLAKLSAYGFDDVSLKWFQSYLSHRQQRVVLDRVYSDWATVVRGVPQGSVLGPLLFIVYMNDLATVIKSHLHLFADDIALYASSADPVLVQHTLNSDLAALFKWVTSNGFMVNISKCQSMFMARRHRCHQLSSIQLLLNNSALQTHKSVRHLGITVDDGLTWSDQVKYVRKKSLSTLAAIHRVSLYLSSNVLVTLYNAFVLPYLTYCCVVWHFCSKTLSDNLQRVQNYAMRLILKLPIELISSVVVYQVHRCVLKVAPAYLLSKFSSNLSFGYGSTRGRDNLHLFHPQTDFGKNTLVSGSSMVYLALSVPC